MGEELPSLAELKELYRRNVNIMGLWREKTGSRHNSVEAILVSYDLQAGSYVRALQDPVHRPKFDLYTAEIAACLRSLGVTEILEAGVGEATTLSAVTGLLQPQRAAGFDISWSRIAHGQRYAAGQGISPRLFTGDLFHIPVRTSAFEAVYTAHSIEPNHGREREALAELARISRRWIALFEPSYELGSAETRARIEEHGYCRGLPDAARELGLRVVRHELLASSLRQNNQTALLLLEKPEAAPALQGENFYACPRCHDPLQAHGGAWFCETCSLIYPVIAGVPCLLPSNGILGSKFLELT